MNGKNKKFSKKIQILASGCITPNEQFFSYIMARTSNILWKYNNVPFVLDQQA